jgi:hypothetical protein
MHGGSGLGWTREDVFNAFADDLFAEADALHQSRLAEAEAMKTSPKKS